MTHDLDVLFAVVSCFLFIFLLSTCFAICASPRCVCARLLSSSASIKLFIWRGVSSLPVFKPNTCSGPVFLSLDLFCRLKFFFSAKQKLLQIIRQITYLPIFSSLLHASTEESFCLKWLCFCRFFLFFLHIFFNWHLPVEHSNHQHNH